MNVTTKITGDKKLIEKLKALNTDVTKVMEEVVLDTAADIQLNAKNTARAKKIWDQGELVQGITLNPVSNLSYNIISTASHSGYVEFGTGPQVQVPEEFRSYADRVRTMPKGDFQQGLRSIRDWCRRHGLEENLAWVIFMSILRRGLHPRPFMFPSFIRGQRTFEKKARLMIEQLTKKF